MVTLLILFTSLSVDSVRFQVVPLEGKLPQLSVYSIAADSTGFLWMTTLEGIARWDGLEVEAWKEVHFLDTTPRLFADGQGWIWAHTIDDQVFVKKKDSSSFARVEGALSATVAPNGVPWLWTTCGPISLREGIACSDTMRISPPKAWQVDTHDQVWYVSRQVLRCWDAPALRVAFAHPVHFLYTDNRNRLWIQYGDTLARFYVEKGCDLRSDKKYVISTPLRDGKVDVLGRFWGATLSGMVSIEKNNAQWFTLPFPYQTQVSKFILSLTVDAWNRVWVGTIGGVYVWDPWRPDFRHIGTSEGLRSGYISALLPEGDTLWVGSVGGGLYRFIRRHHTWREGMRIAVGDDFIWAIARDARGQHWVAADRGLLHLEAGRWFQPEPRAAATPGPNTFTQLLYDGQYLWAGTYGGKIYRVEKDSLVSLFVLPSPVRSLFREGDTLWIGTQDGLYRATPDSLQVHRILKIPDIVVWSIKRTSDGLWLGTCDGLWFYGSDTLLHWTEGQGLPSTTIYGILVAGYTLWLSTNHGLVRVNTRTNPYLRFRHYGKWEGLGMMEFNRGAYAEDQEGNFYFGGIHGVVWFNPSRIRPYPFAPRPVLLYIYHRVGNHLERVPYTNQPLIFGPQDRTVGFQFQGLFLSYPEGVRFRAILHGVAREDLPLGTERKLFLVGLHPGVYQLDIEATGPEGQTGRLLRPVTFEIRPYLWERRPVQVLFILLIMGFLGTGIYYILAERYRRKWYARQIIEQERRRLLRDLHDDLGSTLTGLYLNLSTLAHRRPTLEACISRSQEAAFKVREAIDQLRQILWSLEGENNALPAVVAYLRRMLTDMAEAGGIKLHTIISPELPSNRKVSGEKRYHLVRMLREGMHNILQHARATEVTFEVHLQGDSLVCILKDNGRGFIPEHVVRRGLRFMGERAAAVGGVMELHTAPGKGTELIFRIPLDRK